MKLIICIVYFICTGSAVTGQDTSTLLATTCCFKKNLGGVAFTLVEGNTIEGNGCLDDCVYARDDSPGDQYCFAKGNQMVECSNSETEFQGVNVTSSKRAADNYTDWMSFNTTIGFINCTLKTVLPFVGPSQDVVCSLTGLTPGELDSSTKPSTAGQEPVGDTNVPFIYSMLEGNIQRFSIFSEDCFINCPWGSICTMHHRVDYNTIYVEGALQVDNMMVCWEICNRIDQPNCKFWTWSDLEEKNWAIDDGRQKRNHDNKSECGLRNYTVNKLIPTAQGQFCAKRDQPLSDVKHGSVYVGQAFNHHQNESSCLNECYKDNKCNSWTFQYPAKMGTISTPLCVLNYGITERKIKVCKYVYCGPRRGVIVSGNKIITG